MRVYHSEVLMVRVLIELTRIEMNKNPKGILHPFVLIELTRIEIKKD